MCTVAYKVRLCET